MANPIQFDLNAEIQAWRHRLSSSPEIRAEDLDELESHLRDSVAALRDKGLTEAEAFLIATRRIGSPSALQPEFAKVNAREVWLDRLLWMLLGFQAWFLIFNFSRLASARLVLGGMKMLGYDDSDGSQVALIQAVAHYVVVGLSVWFSFWIARRGKNGLLAKIGRQPRLIVSLLTLASIALPAMQWAGFVQNIWRVSPNHGTTMQIPAAAWTIMIFSLAQDIALLVPTVVLLRRFFGNRIQRA